MWTRLLDLVLTRGIGWGRLHLRFPDGQSRIYGTEDGPEAHVAITDARLLPRLLLNPQMGLGEGYMDGLLTFRSDEDIRAFLQILITCSMAGRLPLPMRLAGSLRRKAKAVSQWNSLRTSRAHVQHHYDLTDGFYALFLDPMMQYTCAHFSEHGMSLEAAQVAKMDLIARKLCLRPGQRVLDIGCGWGGLALWLARHHGVHVTGVTLSETQLSAARSAALEMGLSDSTDFRLLDYRQVSGRFDRVVSVGMMEHVGSPQYRVYFDKIAGLLAPDGIGLIHFIGRSTPPGVLSPWFNKYIFPGGYAPAFSEVIPKVEAAGLVMTDLEVWRDHYPQTLHHWQTRFAARESDVRSMYDDRFIRMWRWYLYAAEASFTHMGHVVFQMQISRDPLAVPATRAYLANPRADL